MAGKSGNEWSSTSKATASPTPMQIAWAAGVYEGEGHCSACPQAAVTQKDEWLLYEFRRLFGGRVRKKTDSSLGYGKEPCSIWIVSGARARGFLMTIYSFMSPRRKTQILRVLDSQRRVAA